MSNTMTIAEAREVMKTISGLYVACVVDTKSGMVLDTIRNPNTEWDVELWAAAITEVIQTEEHVLRALQSDDSIEDILITDERHYHILKPFENNAGMFIFCVINRSKGNLAMARMIIRRCEAEVII